MWWTVLQLVWLLVLTVGVVGLYLQREQGLDDTDAAIDEMRKRMDAIIARTEPKRRSIFNDGA